LAQEIPSTFATATVKARLVSQLARPIRRHRLDYGLFKILCRAKRLSCLLATLALSAQERQTEQGVNFYSREKEAVLGAQLAQEVRRSTTAIDSTTVHNYVERRGRQLAAQLPGAGSGFTFEAVDGLTSPTHEPVSLPGGYIFVPASLILTAQNEAEFAGMLAHAIAHVVERHGTRQATRASIMGDVPLVYVGGWSGHGGEASLPVGFLGFWRAFELEADGLAVKMISGAGYDPRALVRYIGRVQPEDTARLKVFSALPSRDSRIGDMEKAIQALPSKTYSSRDELPSIQSEVRRLTPNQVRREPSLLHPDEDQQKR
jgi:predicted Zn-dependent protease